MMTTGCTRAVKSIRSTRLQTALATTPRAANWRLGGKSIAIPRSRVSNLSLVKRDPTAETTMLNKCGHLTSQRHWTMCQNLAPRSLNTPRKRLSPTTRNTWRHQCRQNCGLKPLKMRKARTLTNSSRLLAVKTSQSSLKVGTVAI